MVQKYMRKQYIDNLRWIAIFLLIPYHAAMAWNVWGEPNYISLEGNRILSSIIVFLSPYLMPLLFLMAGMCTRFALRKRTVGQYVLERAKKLLLPSVFGTILIMPWMAYIADKFNYGYQGDYFQHCRIFFTKHTDLTGADGGFSVGQFWFVLYLFLISVAAMGIFALQKKILPKCNKGLPPARICLLGLPLPFLSGLLSAGGKSLAEYGYIFLVGYYFFANDDIMDWAEHRRWLFLCTGLAATAVYTYLFLWSDTQALFIIITKFLSEWVMVVALLGMGKRYLNFSGNVSGYLSQRSYAFYIFHYIWVVLFQYVMSDMCGGNTTLLYIAPVCLAYSATLLCCELWIRRMPFFRTR